MTSHQLASIYEERDQINRLHSIPTTHHRLLEDRLVIACSEFKRQGRSKIARSTGETKAHHAQKKAHEVYLHVLDEDPQIFLPFLLAINTDTGCSGFNLSQFRKKHDQRASLHLSRAGRAILQGIARRRRIGSSTAFQKLIQALFPTTTALDSPATTADGPKAWRYKAAGLEVVRSQFAVSVCEAIAKAPAVGESVQYSTRTTTGSVRMEFPSIDSEDCILRLDVGDAVLFESVLFPTAFRIQESGNVNDVPYTLKGACLAAAALIFGSQLCEAIDTSQLRTWEKDNTKPTNTTECITMKVYAHEPGYGTLRLRLEFLRGLRIAQRLFAGQNPSGL